MPLCQRLIVDPEVLGGAMVSGLTLRQVSAPSDNASPTVLPQSEHALAFLASSSAV